MLRTPAAVEGSGGTMSETKARKEGRTVLVRYQAAEIAYNNGLKVQDSVAESLTLPTPTATYGGTSAASHLSRKPGRTKVTDLRMIVEENLLETGGKLFPTPNTMDHLNPRSPEKIAESKKRNPGGYANVRETVVNDLLPTITTQDGKNNGGPSQFNRNTKPLNTQVLVKTEWGKFEPAIRRWEAIIGREAPAPTKPDGRDNTHRLSSEFTEWMMGLPKGWITDVGLRRNDELKACGNGVVPQQATLALTELLNGLDW